MIIRPITGSPASADVAADLRDLADLVENDGDGFIAAMLRKVLSEGMWPSHAASWDSDADNAACMAEAIRRFKTVASGPIAKTYGEMGEGYFNARVPMRALTIELTDLRAKVCERVVTGVEVVTEDVPDPEYIAAAPTVTVTRNVEQVEWRCGSILAPSEAVSA